MSMLLIVKAMKAKVGHSTRKLVLIKLADNANDEGFCWPSYQHIADHCEISKRSAMRHVDRLIDDGFLTREYREGPKGNSSNMYHLTLGGDNLSLGGSDTVSPRTSHSFEPVKESKRFAPPTEKEVLDFMSEKGYPYRIEAEKFWNYYESNGWKVGKNKMKNWKSAATGWIQRANLPKKKTEQQSFVSSKPTEEDLKSWLK